jgi:hypothetical protein
MIRLLPFAIEAFLVVFGVVDCVLSDASRIRNLPRWAWILLIVVIPLVGCIAWLVGGRPFRSSRRVTTPKSADSPTWEHPPYQRPIAPDDDPNFIAQLKRTNTEHERILKRWEEDLRRREEELRQEQEPDDAGPEPDDR